MTMPEATTPPTAERSATLPWSPGEMRALLAIAFVGAFARLYGLGDWSMAAEEVRTWQGATQPLDGSPSLVPLVLGALLDSGLLLSTGEGWLRLPFAFAGVLTVPLVALAASLAVPRTVALVAAALFAVHPWHVALSQSAVPATMALLCVVLSLGGALASVRGRRWPRLAVCAGAAALGCFCDPSGWLVLPLLAAGWTAARWQRANGRTRGMLMAALLGAMLLAGLLLRGNGPQTIHVAPGCAFATAAGWAVALAGLAALVLCRPFPGRAALVVAVPGASVLVAVAFGMQSGVALPREAALPLLLPLLLLAAIGVQRCGDLVRAGMGSDALAPVGAWAPLVLLASFLVVETVLHATSFDGGRPPWREARNEALAVVQSPRDLVVGAAAGWPSLCFYLRPNHWRGQAADPHPGKSVELVDLADAAASLQALAARAPAEHVVLVLRGDEVRAIDASPADSAVLRKAFVEARILPRPLDDGDATLHVFRTIARE